MDGLPSSLLARRQLTVPHATQHTPSADFSLTLHICYEVRITIEAIRQPVHLHRAQKCPPQGLGRGLPLPSTGQSDPHRKEAFPEKRHSTPFRVSVITKSLSLQSPCALRVGRKCFPLVPPDGLVTFSLLLPLT